jgi:hypothetical protein
LKSAYTQECDAFILSHSNQPTTQRNAADLFKRAYLRVTTLDKAENSFRADEFISYTLMFFHPNILALHKFRSFQTWLRKILSFATEILLGEEASPKHQSTMLSL